MRTITLATLALGFQLGGCALATYSPLAVCSGPVHEVRILKELPPVGSYTTCGSVRIEAGGLASMETTIDAAKEEARRHGANAIVIVGNPEARFTWAKSYSREGSAIAVRVHGK